MPKSVEFYFTVLSSYTYLATPRLAEMAARTGALVVFRPMDIMKVFEAAGTTPPAKQPDCRKRYRAADLARIAKANGMPMNAKPAFWPVAQNLASGAIIAAQEAGADPMPLTQAVLKAVWVEDRNVADDAVVAGLAASCGFDAGLLAQAKSDAVQDIFAANTADAIANGVFGSPSFIVDGDLFWGQDRLAFVEAAL